MSNPIINRRVILSGGIASSPAPVVSVLQPWYDSLSVKPSAGLWADLQTMADGMDADGNWDEMDFISVHAGLETEEQRYTPFKSTSGNDLSNDGDIVNDVNGLYLLNPNDATSAVNSGYNPFLNSVKFSLNDGFFGSYYNTDISGVIESGYFLGSSDNLGFVLDVTVFAVNAFFTAFNNDNGPEATKSDFLNDRKNVFVSISKQTAGDVTLKINNVSNSAVAIPVSLANANFSIFSAKTFGAVNGISRASVIGSGLINHNQIASRLNTFFSSRGLPIGNY